MIDTAPEASIRQQLQDAVRDEGFVFAPAAQVRAWLEGAGALDGWPAFAASWDDLGEDLWMADGGRYRRRRHAIYALDAAGAISRQPHAPHYQSRDYNPLNGGVARWFAPVDTAIGAGAPLLGVLRACHDLFRALAPETGAWHVEVHQFRIEAHADLPGEPTPEGRHRDGVDFVLVLLIRRHNIVRGTTSIHAADGRELGSFTLTQPFDAALVDDRRVLHGVTAVQPQDPSLPAHRDVLVVTFRRRD